MSFQFEWEIGYKEIPSVILRINVQIARFWASIELQTRTPIRFINEENDIVRYLTTLFQDVNHFTLVNSR